MKIDVSKIENFDNLTAEEKVNALMEYEVETEDVVKLKNALNKASADAAEAKRALRARQTEAEQAEAERAEKEKEREELLRTLMREKTILDNKSQFLSVGYDNDLAQKSAEAMADGNMADIFSGFKSFLEARERQIKSELLNKTPAPVPGSNAPGAITKAEFDKMGYSERAKLFKEHPEIYKQMTE